MAFDRTKHCKDIGIKPGKSGNPKGSKQKVRIIKSRLRKTSDSLREVEDAALESIKKVVNGDKVNKDQLETSKWVISTIMQIDKAASSEELSSAKIRLESKKSEEAGAGVNDITTSDVVPIARLKLTYDADAEIEQED